jgi:small subunit ribosomal protein S3
MGQKVNPKVFRIGITRGWNSKWFSQDNFVELLRQDVIVRKFLLTKLRDAGVSQVDIERGPEKLVINVHVAKPGLVIGKGGAGTEDLKKELTKKVLNKKFSSVTGKLSVSLNVIEVANPNLEAQIIVDSMIMELEKRVAYRRIMKQTIQKVMKSGAKGVKVLFSGRLNGSDIARRESLAQGRLPLHTLRADIDYSRGAAQTMFGKVGVKVWIYRGDVFNGHGAPVAKEEQASRQDSGRAAKTFAKPTAKK